MHAAEHDLELGDVILLCSDGLHGAVDDTTLAQIATNQKDIQIATRQMVDVSLDRGSRDNVTAMLVRLRRRAGVKSASPARADVPTPTAIGPYVLRACLASGATGHVYLADDPATGTPVAVKVLAADLQDEPETRERFYREARILAELTHPNIVRVLDIGEEQGRPYIAMELLDGFGARRASPRTSGLAARPPHRPDPAALLRPRGRARQGNGAPRREAGEHHRAGRRPSEDLRLRPGATARVDPHGKRCRRRLTGLHVA